MKPFHLNVTGRECGGGMSVLAGLTWEAAEVPEEYFCGHGVSTPS